MSVKVATGEMLLDALVENANIKAAVLVDERGYIVEQRGDARSLKGFADTGDAGPSENLYLVTAGTNFLIVVFDERLNFERIKSFVDGRLSEFGMAPDLDE